MSQRSKNICFLSLCLIFLIKIAIADTVPQSDTSYYQHNTLKKIIPLSELAFYGVSFSYLWQSWYKNYPQSSFHSFNDNEEWMQLDKVSHCNVAYWLTKLDFHLLRSAGYTVNQSRWISASSSLVAMGSIEVFDGFSKEWGASWGDLVADASGTTLYMIQNLTNTEDLLQLKFSYWPSSYRAMRPSALGSNAAEGIIKDYNGHTHWLSVNVNQLGANSIPRWLNFAVGYGARGMTGGETNYLGTIPNSERQRCFYLSPDINWMAFHPRNRLLKAVFYTLQFVKVPAPTLECNGNGLHWWWIK